MGGLAGGEWNKVRVESISTEDSLAVTFDSTKSTVLPHFPDHCIKHNSNPKAGAWQKSSQSN